MLRSWSEAEPWVSREVEIVVPMHVAHEMWERGRKWDVSSGGRFDTHSSSVLLWSRPIQADERWPALVGSFFIRWRSPNAHSATIYAIAWNPEEGGSDAEMYQAIGLLSGQLVAA